MSSSRTWISVTPNMNRAVDIINGIDTKRFNLFLNRITSEMKQNTNSLKPFSDEELHKLQDSFSIDSEQLNLLLHSSILILSQAVYHITNPEILNSTLTNNLKMNEDKAAAFGNVWSNNAKALIFKLKHKPVYSTQVDDIGWLVNIETSSQNSSHTFIPKAILQLKLKNENGLKNLHLELTEKHLFNVYNTLENIQNSLDSLSRENI